MAQHIDQFLPVSSFGTGRTVRVTQHDSAYWPVVPTPRAAGTYQPSTGQAACLDAEPGYYVSITGQSSRHPAPLAPTSPPPARPPASTPTRALRRLHRPVQPDGLRRGHLPAIHRPAAASTPTRPLRPLHRPVIPDPLPRAPTTPTLAHPTPPLPRRRRATTSPHRPVVPDPAPLAPTSPPPARPPASTPTRATSSTGQSSQTPAPRAPTSPPPGRPPASTPTQGNMYQRLRSTIKSLSRRHLPALHRAGLMPRRHAGIHRLHAQTSQTAHAAGTYNPDLAPRTPQPA